MRAAREADTTKLILAGKPLDVLILHLRNILLQPSDDSSSSPCTPGESPRSTSTTLNKIVQNTTSVVEGGPKDVVHLLIQLVRCACVRCDNYLSSCASVCG